MLDISININETLIILFRIGLAVVLAFIPGIERELTGKFAGLRTHILVCLGACVFTILSVYGFEMRSSQEYAELNGLSRPFIQNDPARIAAQVITGIGFIGAGTVMRHGSNVFGITTAATLWMCAAIGMSCGCGEYMTAIIASFATLVVLISIRRLEKKVLSKRKVSYKDFEISIVASIEACDGIELVFENSFKKIYKLNKKLINHSELRYSAVVTTKKTLKEINDYFKNLNCIESIEIREHYE
ncbi:MAG: MgtC/SapB family protein [Candidatus Gastranaerophilales bacterium]|nr:MgtC/SapB family protein [Candidatus Gastranaerophilales bacterium]